MASDFLTVDDVAKRLKLNPQTVRRWIRRGLLPAAKLGGKEWRVRMEDLERVTVGPVADRRRGEAAALRLLALRERLAGGSPTLAEILAESRAELERRGAPDGS
jgi:excisionase family DNA binding protein